MKQFVTFPEKAFAENVDDDPQEDTTRQKKKEEDKENNIGIYRIVVCLDVEATSLKVAYRTVYRELKKVCPSVQWESSDEWYDAEAEEVEPDAVQAVRMEVFAEENDK